MSASDELRNERERCSKMLKKARDGFHLGYTHETQVSYLEGLLAGIDTAILIAEEDQ